MLDADAFDALEYVARELRRNPAPFGGIRLVLSGDFFQVRSRGMAAAVAAAAAVGGWMGGWVGVWVGG